SQLLLKAPARSAGEMLERAEPEAPPEHGGVQERGLLLAWKGVEACADDPLDRQWQLEVRSGCPAVVQHPRELLHIEGIPLCPRNDGGDELAEVVARKQTGHELDRLVLRERSERDRRGVRLAGAPVGTSGLKLGPCRAHD